MLEKYAETLRRLPPGAQRSVARALNLPPYRGALYEMLEAAGYWQSDVVLVLIRENTNECLRAAEALVGHPILRCPPGARRIPERVTLAAGAEQVLRIIGLVDRGDLRKFAWIAPNAQLPTTDSHWRFRLLKIGMTVGGFVARGGWRRDVKEWADAGKVRLS